MKLPAEKIKELWIYHSSNVYFHLKCRWFFHLTATMTMPTAEYNKTVYTQLSRTRTTAKRCAVVVVCTKGGAETHVREYAIIAPL